MSRSLILPFTKKLGGALNHNVFSEVDQTDLQKFRCPGASRGILKLRNDRHITSRGRKREDPGNEDVFTQPALARACLTFLRHNLEVCYTWARRVISFYGALCNCKENFVTDPILESKSKQCPVICQMLPSFWNVKRETSRIVFIAAQPLLAVLSCNSLLSIIKRKRCVTRPNNS